jgi:hypothetical protein
MAFVAYERVKRTLHLYSKSAMDNEGAPLSGAEVEN